MTSSRTVLSFDVGLRHLAYVRMSVPCEGGLPEARIDAWDVVDVLEGRKVDRVAFDETVETLLRVLQGLDEASEAGCDVVLIENQPCTMNPRLKSVQMVMYTYFKVMHMHTGRFPDVRLVPASGKLQGLTHAPEGLVPARAASMSYAQKKRASIVACEHYLRAVLRHEGGRADDFASSGGKRDDLADCMLQAFAFVERVFTGPDPPPPRGARSRRRGADRSATPATGS